MKKTAVLDSRNVALFAAQAALSDRGFRGEEFVIESFAERKRIGSRRFINLWLTTAGGSKATVAVNLVKKDEWEATKVRVLQTKNAPERRLGYLRVTTDTEGALALIASFIPAFPSIRDLDPMDVLRSITRPFDGSTVIDEKAESDIQAAALARMDTAIEEASYGQWYGSYEISESGKAITLIPYIGDRTIQITGGDTGWGHGRNWGMFTITVDCIKRPSGFAMKQVIAWVREHGEKWEAHTLWGTKDRDFGREKEVWTIEASNRSIAQYFLKFVDEEGAVPHRNPNQLEDWTAVDWLFHYSGELARAERMKDEHRISEIRLLANELLGYPDLGMISGNSLMIIAIGELLSVEDNTELYAHGLVHTWTAAIIDRFPKLEDIQEQLPLIAEFFKTETL